MTKPAKSDMYLAEWAKALGWSQAAIIRETGFDKATVSNWFARRTMPGPERRATLAKVLGLTSPAQLFTPPDRQLRRDEQRLHEIARDLSTKDLQTLLTLAERLAEDPQQPK